MAGWMFGGGWRRSLSDQSHQRRFSILNSAVVYFPGTRGLTQFELILSLDYSLSAQSGTSRLTERQQLTATAAASGG